MGVDDVERDEPRKDSLNNDNPPDNVEQDTQNIDHQIHVTGLMLFALSCFCRKVGAAATALNAIAPHADMDLFHLPSFQRDRRMKIGTNREITALSQ
jgi:hypothetical protein